MKLLILALSAVVLAPTANATVINVSGTLNGEQGGNGACLPIDSPCTNGALIDPVQVTLAAGTYTVSDAYNPATGFKSGAIYDAWNFEAGNPTPWVWNYHAFYDDGAQGSTINPTNFYNYLLFDPNAPTEDRRSTEAEAAAVGADTPAFTFTIDKSTTIDFVVNDYYLPDNAGGVSLDIEPAVTAAVPESPVWAMMILGFGALGGTMRRRQQMGLRFTPA